MAALHPQIPSPLSQVGYLVDDLQRAEKEQQPFHRPLPLLHMATDAVAVMATAALLQD